MNPFDFLTLLAASVIVGALIGWKLGRVLVQRREGGANRP